MWDGEGERGLSRGRGEGATRKDHTQGRTARHSPTCIPQSLILCTAVRAFPSCTAHHTPLQAGTGRSVQPNLLICMTYPHSLISCTSLRALPQCTHAGMSRRYGPICIALPVQNRCIQSSPAATCTMRHCAHLQGQAARCSPTCKTSRARCAGPAAPA